VESDKSAIGNRQSAMIFPGQGSQAPGMGKDLAEKFPVARQVFEEADDALGFAISRLCFEGPAEDLQLTENTQPAILTVSVAAFRALREAEIDAPAFVAGHSLGEYSALVAAGVLSLSDAVRTVRARGRYMQEAVPVGTGAMAAVIGGELSDVERICAEARGDQVCSVANFNSPSQAVIAGNTEAVDRAVELLSGVAKRVIKLKVSAPFHCALMKPAQDRLAQDLERLQFNNPALPAPVRWVESMQLLIEQGVDTFVEAGPGKVLSGLMRQTSRDVKTLNVEDVI
jgi:[acyl-carrier-protein] S-malonyltransferase